MFRLRALLKANFFFIINCSNLLRSQMTLIQTHSAGFNTWCQLNSSVISKASSLGAEQEGRPAGELLGSRRGRRGNPSTTFWVAEKVGGRWQTEIGKCSPGGLYLEGSRLNCLIGQSHDMTWFNEAYTS